MQTEDELVLSFWHCHFWICFDAKFQEHPSPVWRRMFIFSTISRTWFHGGRLFKACTWISTASSASIWSTPWCGVQLYGSRCFDTGQHVGRYKVVHSCIGIEIYNIQTTITEVVWHAYLPQDLSGMISRKENIFCLHMNCNWDLQFPCEAFQ